MWQIASIFGTVMIFGIGVAICALLLFPVIICKNQKLYEKYGEDFEKEYTKIYKDRKITSLGKILLIVGVFLTTIAMVLLLLLI